MSKQEPYFLGKRERKFEISLRSNSILIRITKMNTKFAENCAFMFAKHQIKLMLYGTCKKFPINHCLPSTFSFSLDLISSEYN